jgi:hypothetical protein
MTHGLSLAIRWPVAAWRPLLKSLTIGFTGNHMLFVIYFVKHFSIRFSLYGYGFKVYRLRAT